MSNKQDELQYWEWLVYRLNVSHFKGTSNKGTRKQEAHARLQIEKLRKELYPSKRRRV